jgi:hypothetical protein
MLKNSVWLEESTRLRIVGRPLVGAVPGIEVVISGLAALTVAAVSFRC